jgi:hypothetical protein
MQIRKTYKEINPDLFYDEVKDFALKRGVVIDEAKLETYSLPNDSSSFITRGTLRFKIKVSESRVEEECLMVHLVGSAKDETKVTFDINEVLFPEEKSSALLEDLDFIFGSHDLEHS